MSSSARVTLASRVHVNDDVKFQELQGEAVLLSLTSATYFGLDEVGTRIWQLLAEHEQLSEIARVIVDEYDVDESRCASEIVTLISDLERSGLVTVSMVAPRSEGCEVRSKV